MKKVFLSINSYRIVYGSSIILFFLLSNFLAAQTPDISFTVSMEQPATHTFHVEMKCAGLNKESVDFKMPVWSPGYYQRLDFAKNVENLRVSNGEGAALEFDQKNGNTWTVRSNHSNTIVLNYDVKTIRPFVGTPYLDEERGYILPAALFFHPAGMINSSSSVSIKPFSEWKDIATGLDKVDGKPYTYFAPDYDILYDSPILIGNLEELPSFTVKGIPHYFVGYNMGEFDKESLMNDLKKIVEVSVSIIGDIPYKHYTFIGIGPGQGGIEHLNSTTVSFNGSRLDSQENRLRTLFFLAHEYFHHYNVKRIRPIELGPFDYDNGSRTKLLWVSEGLSVYYEYLIVKRAGLCSEDEMLKAFQSDIQAFEGKPGRLYQTLVEASYETWSDGPFGRTGDEVNKTISYYSKGPAVGLLLNFQIQEATNNKYSLDDVMQRLYKQYYLELGRGFTEDEFKNACEETAGIPLDEVFQYVNTTQELDYNRYLNYAGYTVDTTLNNVPGGWLGISSRIRNDSLRVSDVEYQSPAWEAGIRRGYVLLEVSGKPARDYTFSNVLEDKNSGERINLVLFKDKKKENISLTLGTKKERSFLISTVQNPTIPQIEIRYKWLNGDNQ